MSMPQCQVCGSFYLIDGVCQSCLDKPAVEPKKNAGHGGNPRSLEAHHSLRESAQAVEDQVVAWVTARGQNGAIADEIVRAWNCSHNHVAPRLTTAMKKGRLVRSGELRKTEAGRDADVVVAPQFATGQMRLA